MATVSIIIPTFNSEKYILETLQCVADQSHADLECILVDDGSVDKTKKIVKDFVHVDPRFLVLERDSKMPKGANACRNTALYKARGDYIIFLDADDLLATTSLADRLADFSEHADMDGLIYTTRSFETLSNLGPEHNQDPEVESAENYLKMFLSYEIPWQITSPIWKRETLLHYGGFDLNFARFQDVELHTRMLLGGAKVKRIHKADFFYRQPDQGAKYKNQAFLERALQGISTFIEKFSKDSFSHEVISFEERRELLKTAMRKCFDKFIIPNKMWWQGKNLLRIAQKSNLISLKEAFAFKVYLYMIRSNKHKTKGFGMYRLYSWSRSVSGLKSEVL